MQKTNFKFEAVVHDDASTDKSADIIREYEAKYPDIIRPIYQKINGFGSERNFRMKQKAWRGKYLAMCEGDDYWTDPYKLQKQVDFLEANPDYVICFHNAEVINEVNNQRNLFHRENMKDTYNIYDLSQGPFFTTASTIYRRGYIKSLPDWFYKTTVGDWPLFMLLAQYGNIHYIDEVMSVRRQHEKGYWHSKTKVEQFRGLIKTARLMRNNFDFDIQKNLNITISGYYYQIANIYKRSNQRLKLIIYIIKGFISALRYNLHRIFRNISR